MHPIIFLPVVGVLVYLLLRLLLSGRNTTPEASDSEDELVRLCFGNKKQAERLIELERKNAPKISRPEAAKRASRSIRRDLN
jgi:hypothetical protein